MPPVTKAAAPSQPQTVDTPVVSCDGGSGGLGHPRVTLAFGAERQVVCPYCSATFVLAEGAPAGHGH